MGQLLDIARGQPQQPVLYYQTDDALLLVSRNRARLQQAYQVLLPAARLVEDLVDKSRFTVLAGRMDLPVPRTTVLSPSGTGVPDTDLRYPVVLKPSTRAALDRLGHEGKAQLVRSSRELQQRWPELSAAGVELIAQEFIPGAEGRVESYHAYVDHHGSIAGDFTGVKIRTRPSRFGFSTAISTTAASDVAAAGRELVDRLAFRGVLKADYKRGPDGRLHLLEINPRFNLWHHVGAAAGVNLPAMVYADLLGMPRAPTGLAAAGRTWCHAGGDWHAAKESGMGRAAWVRWVLQTSARAEGRWSDPMPLVRGVLVPKARTWSQRSPRSSRDAQ